MTERQNFKTVQFSDEFEEHFKGFMLGDGYLSNRNKSKHSCQFLISNVNPDYIRYVSKLLENEGIDHTVQIGSKKGNFPGSKKSSIVSTKFYKTFADQEEKWYKTRSDGTHFKIVPPDLKLTPLSLLQWYIGDGYLVNLKGKPERVQICTDRYSDDEILMLKEMFERDLGLNIQVDWNRRRLRIPKRMLADFFDLLPECPTDIQDALGYKWAV